MGLGAGVMWWTMAREKMPVKRKREFNPLILSTSCILDLGIKFPYGDAMSTADKLLVEIEAFLKRHKMTPGRFGIDANLDHKFVARLRAGRGCHSSSIDDARAFMSSYRAAARQKKAAHHSAAA